MQRQDVVWRAGSLVETFLTGVRGGLPLAAEQIEMMLRIVSARSTPVRHFIDLGCGDGILAAAVLARYASAEAVLVDFSEPMLDAARARFGDRQPTPRFVQADLADPSWLAALPTRADIDAVVSAYAIHHLSDERKRALYAEIFGLLAPGGVFVNVEHVASPTPWLAEIFDEMMVDSITAYHARQGTGKSREEVASEFVHRPDKVANILAPVETQTAWLREIGYSDVDCYFKALEFAVFGGRKLDAS